MKEDIYYLLRTFHWIVFGLLIWGIYAGLVNIGLNVPEREIEEAQAEYISSLIPLVLGSLFVLIPNRFFLMNRFSNWPVKIRFSLLVVFGALCIYKVFPPGDKISVGTLFFSLGVLGYAVSLPLSVFLKRSLQKAA